MSDKRTIKKPIPLKKGVSKKPSKYTGISLNRFVSCPVFTVESLTEDVVIGRIVGFLRDGEHYNRKLIVSKIGIPVTPCKALLDEEGYCLGETHAYVLFYTLEHKTPVLLLAPISILEPSSLAECKDTYLDKIPATSNYYIKGPARGRPHAPKNPTVFDSLPKRKPSKKVYLPRDYYNILFKVTDNDLLKEYVDKQIEDNQWSARAVVKLLAEATVICFKPDLKTLKEVSLLCKELEVNVEDSFNEFMEEMIEGLNKLKINED